MISAIEAHELSDHIYEHTDITRFMPRLEEAILDAIEDGKYWTDFKCPFWYRSFTRNELRKIKLYTESLGYRVAINGLQIFLTWEVA